VADVEAQPAPTLTEYSERWLKDVAANIAAGTLKSYTTMLSLHIRPVLGDVPLPSLTRAQVKSLLTQKREKGLGKKGLGKNSIRLIRATLSVMLNDAVEDGVLPTNVATGIGRGRKKRGDAVTQAERRQSIRPLSVEQLDTFLRAAATKASKRDATLFLTLADTGMRPGEALALRWDDVDVNGRSIRVERALADGEIKTTKTGETRDVDMTRRLAAALSAWQATQEAAALVAVGGKAQPSPWVFPEGSRPLDAQKAANRYRSVLRVAGLPRFRLYDLRHSFATHLLAENAPITYVAAQMGHAKPTTTLQFYAHWIPAADKAVIDRLEARRNAARPAEIQQNTLSGVAARP
jgi:integrase